MLNLYRLLIICLLFSGCSAQRWCEKHYPSEVSDSTFTKTDTVIMWDTVKVPEISIEFDTTFDFIPRGVDFYHEEKKSGLTSGFSIKNGKIKTLCKADSMELVNKHLTEIISTYHEKKETKESSCSKKHRTTYDNFCRWFTPIILLLILIGVIIKCFRG